LYQISGPWDQEDGGAYGPAFGTKYQLGKNVETIVEGWYRDFTGNLDDTMGENNQLQTVEQFVKIKRAWLKINKFYLSSDSVIRELDRSLKQSLKIIERLNK
jgi:hypothetical protein